MKKTISTVLIVGLGSIGKRHASVIKKLFPKIKIVVFRHKKCDEMDVKSLGLYKCVTSLEEAIATNPQLGIIANPAIHHIKLAKELAIHGIDMLVEKPISTNSIDAKELIELAEKNNIFLTVGYNLRFLPSLIYFKNSIHSGCVGEVYSIRAETGQYLPSWRPGNDYRDSVSANKSLGGGVLLELSHEIDYLMWIFGSISWVKSHASRQSSLELTVDDSASMIFGFKNFKNKGVQGKEIVASLNIDFIRHDVTRQCYVIGEKGTLFWDGITGNVSFFSKENDCWLEMFNSHPEKNYTYEEEIMYFFKSVESGYFPLVTAEEALQVLLVVEAVEESHVKDMKVVM